MSLKSVSIAAFLLISLGWSAASAQLTQAPRPFAPGVLKVIAPDLRPEDSYSPPLKIPGLAPTEFEGKYVAQAETLFGQTQQVVFFREVWSFEFATLGLRQIDLKVRMPDGSVADRNFFYMPYRIRNLGKSLTYDQVKEGLVSEFINYKLVPTGSEAENATEPKPASPERFLPQFTLEGLIEEDGNYRRIKVQDHYLPEVARAIQKFEDPNRRLLDQREMESAEFPIVTHEDDPGVWGVAIWEDVDPRLDYISIFVRGITNAYTIRFDAEGNQTLLHKTLQLNYWRPGDSVEQTRDTIIYGIPYEDSALSQVQICQHYQLPGPRLGIYLMNETIDGEAKIAKVDAAIDGSTLETLSAGQLDQGEIPEAVVNEMNGRGFDMGSASAVQTAVPGTRWKFTLDMDGKPREFEIRLEPEVWEKSGKDSIRFIKSLEQMWIYR